MRGGNHGGGTVCRALLPLTQPRWAGRAAVCLQLLSVAVACSVPRGSGPGQLDLSALFTAQQQQRLSLGMMFGLVAAREALEDAGWTAAGERERLRAGVSVGMGMVDLEYIGEAHQALAAGGRKLSPHFIPRILPNLAAGHISIEHGLMGPNHSCSTACATGLHSVGEAARLVAAGVCDLMVAGAVDACISPLGMAGFSRARALSTQFNDRPAAASRPFDTKRDGFVMGEGAGVLVLEREEHARARGARPYCRVSGYGSSGDASHVTTAREDGAGAVASMEAALRDAGRAGTEVWSVNCHATSTPLGDRAECTALRSVLGEASPALLTSNKGSMGHLLGAAGAVEAVFSVLSVREGVVPPSTNIDLLDVETTQGLQVVTDVPHRSHQHSRVLLKNSFGFGGTNASLVFENSQEF